MPPKTYLQQKLLDLLEDYHSFNPNVVTLNPYPTALEFSKQVSKGIPCVYSFKPTNPSTTSRDHNNPPTWPAFSWNRASLTSKVPSPLTLPIATTPNGLADALTTYPADSNTQIFLQPATTEMTMSSLLSHFHTPNPAPTSPDNPTFYLQSQNSNLTALPALQPLLQDIPASINFATPVLGEPDAINLWIGDERSITSAHRDPYENLYVVIKGTKIFTLWAPLDEIVLESKMVRTGRWVYDKSSSRFDVVLDEAEDEDGGEPPMIPWVSVDSANGWSRYARPRTVRVEEGQMLYLPAGWFHAVAQECGFWEANSGGMERAPCIAVNYWYDQDYEGEKYVMRQFVGELVKSMREEKEDKDQAIS